MAGGLNQDIISLLSIILMEKFLFFGFKYPGIRKKVCQLFQYWHLK